MILEPGATLARGRYRLEALRGRGGMAVVWRALDTQLERPVAIKVIAESLAADAEFRRRFEREARAAAAVSHPHVVKLFDYGLEEDRPYLIMEYVDGPNLAELAKDGGLASLDADRIAHDLLEAICHIHNAGVLHRDIKPANLLMTADGQIRVTDFGIARLDETTQITRAGMVVGTERYIAPEVAAGRPATPVSDLYSCGAVLGELVAAAGASATLRRLVDALRSEDPSARPRSAEAALDVLRAGADPTAPTRALPATESADGRAEQGAGDDPTTPLTDPTTAVHAPRETEPAATAGAAPPTTAGDGPAAGHRPAAGAGAGRHARGERATAVIASPLSARVARWALPAGIVAVVAALVLALATGGDDAPERVAVPAPAPETAPIGEQLQRLERIVRAIGEHQRP